MSKQYYFSALPANKAIPIFILSKEEFKPFIKSENKAAQNWMQQNNFEAERDRHILIPGKNGGIAKVVAIVGDNPDIWSIAQLPGVLPKGAYRLDAPSLNEAQLERLSLGFALATYQFARYRKPKEKGVSLVVPRGVNRAKIERMIEAIFLVRDMVNTPAEDMQPSDIEKAAQTVAKKSGAKMSVIRGDDLLKKNYPLIHAVGRAAMDAPRLIDFTWGNPKHPKLTLVGKGVCFDTGGLDIKGADYMLLMKKDMGGAAHALALAQYIMAAKMKVRLRVLIPAVENSVSSNSFRPMDIFKSRKGISVEIGNTDAEGRLILADALTEACSEKPDLVIDFATLTGAARVALGPDIPAMFSNDDIVAEDMEGASMMENDPLWRLPLWAGYRTMLNSKAADINNSPISGHGGAITAALFLQEFIEPQAPWVHLDLMAWNTADRPGRPCGGEAMTIRALVRFLEQRYQQ